ncbi:hypothetical protein AMS68_002800 [Peltaster fructicola]|uniref:Uncharacterized protein n=1 Tax=Peltaster fructicola TaxID=286661 RepID=A0A6H0XRF3_9PEZI|nr:hypothetical protein AMS68_002800 [Peltaster fructicola]
MAQDPLEEGTKEERLKTALWYHVGNMIDSVAIEQNINTTPQFIGGLSEMLWSQIGKPPRRLADATVLTSLRSHQS